MSEASFNPFDKEDFTPDFVGSHSGVHIVRDNASGVVLVDLHALTHAMMAAYRDQLQAMAFMAMLDQNEKGVGYAEGQTDMLVTLHNIIETMETEANTGVYAPDSPEAGQPIPGIEPNPNTEVSDFLLMNHGNLASPDPATPEEIAGFGDEVEQALRDLSNGQDPQDG